MEREFTISNENISITITNYGGRITKWLVNGVDIVLGFSTIEEYKSASEPYHSALIGRYSNRIAHANYRYNNENFDLDKNHGKHILHGGTDAFHNALWTVVDISDQHVSMKHVSPDGDQGFPGELTSYATYELVGNTVKLTILAKTTKATAVSFTHHPYFNLSGLSHNDLNQHQFKIYSNKVLCTDANGIPTGAQLAVGFSGFDFTMWRSLSDAMAESHPQIDMLNGIDHNYINSNHTLKNCELQAEAKSLESNIHMQVFSNQPGLQFYTANHFNGQEFGKEGRAHDFRGAFCFEPQQWPDSPNQDSFPNTILLPDEEYLFQVEYRF